MSESSEIFSSATLRDRTKFGCVLLCMISNVMIRVYVYVYAWRRISAVYFCIN